MPANIHTNADELAEASGQAKSDEQELAKKSARQAKARKDAGRAVAANRSGVPATPRNGVNSSVATTTDANGLPRVGRNDLCPCGSGKKYKKCHGA
ncbi:SEC-C metal-binding domain-containing protein [Dictyobacter vulcani]